MMKSLIETSLMVTRYLPAGFVYLKHDQRENRL